jgi:selenocysteine-specific elongation factor
LVADAEAVVASAAVAAQRAEPRTLGLPLPASRSAAAQSLRRGAPGAGWDAADAVAVVDAAVAHGILVRDGDLVRTPDHRPERPTDLQAGMDRLVSLLSVAAPPGLAESARSAGCPPEGVRALEREGRIVRLEPDLAYAAETFASLERIAVGLARRGPLSPAAFRDATGTSRKYALAILEALDGRGVLRRGPAGHVLGPSAPIGDG